MRGCTTKPRRRTWEKEQVARDEESENLEGRDHLKELGIYLN
jgi:hypothetical protein